MDNKLKQIIEKEFGFIINEITDAPRQFVAETYILECQDTKYFCKIVTKELFISPIIESLPILKSLHEQGLERINYPIPTKKGELSLRINNTLIVLFNYIDAKQSEKYDMYSFGKMIATVHSMTDKMSKSIPEEKYFYEYADTFQQQLELIMDHKDGDGITQNLKLLVAKYRDEIKHDYENFISLSHALSTKEFKFVITHGDPGGNTLVKSPTDLYLIDWDNIMLSPPERDTWFFQHDQEFMRGYRSIFPEYQVDEELSHYSTYKRYFEDLVEYFTEILGAGTEEHKLKNLKGLEQDCFEGWLRPAIRQFDPI